MSEYQYYEFLALDRPLTAAEQEKVREYSSRARITATSFVNEYHWGDFRGDPAQLIRDYYDAHLYLANWGTHRIMLRLPRTVLDVDAVREYCVEDLVTITDTGEHVIIDLLSEDEPEWEEDAADSLAVIAGIRTELAAGDMRALYLAWLSACGMRDEDEDEDEDEDPPVPAGLGSLTGPQRALADFLRLDRDALKAAAADSPPLAAALEDARTLAKWITGLPPSEKDRLLLLAAQGQGTRVTLELLQRFRQTPAGDDGGSAP